MNRWTHLHVSLIDGLHAVLHAGFRVWGDVSKKPLRLLLSVAIAAVLGLFFGVRAFALWTIFLLFAMYDWDPRVIGVLAIGFLASCPVLLKFEQKALAEQMAIFAFLFLVMTATLQMIEYKRFPKRFPADEKEAEDV